MSYQHKQKLYSLSRGMLWVCLASIIFYIIVSVFFMVTGTIQSQNFQKSVFSHSIVYSLPLFLIAAWLGTRYFRDGDEARRARDKSLSLSSLLTAKEQIGNAPDIVVDNRSKPNPPVIVVDKRSMPEGRLQMAANICWTCVFSWAFVGLLIVLGAWYYFTDRNDKHNPATSIALAPSGGSERAGIPKPIPIDTLGQTSAANVPVEDAREEENTAGVPEMTEPVKRDAGEGEVFPPLKTRAEDVKRDVFQERPDSEKYVLTETGYKVISKAYFHDQPDESTRRKAFINHWNNSYATLSPLEERNGFVYVVFTNHLNQTSYGWLRKKDLQAVTTKIYEDSK